MAKMKRKPLLEITVKTDRKFDYEQLRYTGSEKRFDFLMYYKPVMYWFKKKNNMTQSEVEMLLYLYGHNLFSKKEFKTFGRLMSWDSDRFKKLMNDGWIVLWRKFSHKKNNHNLYTLSVKGKRLCNSFYKKLISEETIPTRSDLNPMFKKDASYMDKKYREIIQKMNGLVKKGEDSNSE